MSSPSCTGCGRVKTPAGDTAASVEWDFGWGWTEAEGVRCPTCRSEDYEARSLAELALRFPKKE